MKLSSLIVSRPVLIFCFLAIVVLLLPGLVIPCWYKMTKNVKDNVDLSIHQFHSVLLSEVDNIAKALHPLNSSATSLATLISSSLNQTELTTFDAVITKMGPLLFQAFSTIPHISQMSYIGLEGPFLSYYNDGNHIYALYSNSSSSSNAKRTLNVRKQYTSFGSRRKQYTWYKQLVDPNSGKLYGDASVVSSALIMSNTSWILQKALNSSHGFASLGSGWNSGHDPLILNTVGVSGNGVISLGFSLESLTSLFSGVKLYGGSLYLATQNGEMLIRGLLDTQIVVNEKSVTFHLLSDDQVSTQVGDVSCMPNDGSLRASLLKFGKVKYMAYCSPLEIVGLQSVFALTLPNDDIMGRIHQKSKIALILLIVMTGVIIPCILSFVLLTVGAKTREMHLCAALIKQMEETEQAERKSRNKNLAFASASHDIRAALAGITGLIEICYKEVAPGSDLGINLQRMDDCTKDLFGLLNSILDTSKIEAGKMHLEDKEFDLADLLEEEVDFFHPVAAKKGIDVVLDPCDGSILKFSNVRGDRGKLRQVLWNLLSNAVKFTSEGHISVRAWAQKPRLENKIIRSSQNIIWKLLSCLFYKNKEEYNHLETMNTVTQNPNTMEFVFEVDDTGPGIPKEKQKSVFENFVQVKETALGQGGTGLGLGIVQSIVRLMGGEIGIVDKENGERGTCFRFNVFLTTSETNTKADIETGENQYLGLTVRTPISAGLTPRSTSPRLSILSPASKTEGSIVVLLIRSEERQRSTQKFMESLGIKVIVVSQWENLYSTLMKIKPKQNLSPYSSSGKSDFGSRSDKSSARSKDAPLSIMDGIDQPKLPSHHRSNTLRGSPGFVLIVIDASAGPFQDLYELVAEFRRGHHDTSCKVVWLGRPPFRSINLGSQYHENDPDVKIFQKPFHGSRLYQVIRLLPEFTGTFSSQGVSNKDKKEKSPLSPSSENLQSRTRSSFWHSLQNTEIQPEGSSRGGTYRKRFSPQGSSTSEHSGIWRQPVRKHSEIEEMDGSCSTDKPLSGIRFLVAEDNKLLQTLAVTNLLQLGADVELCANGEEAVELVRMNLQDQTKHGNYFVLPYDYILMDCEMPVMNGYEATRQIRKVEKDYGIHIPIIALTAHTSGGDAERTREAGMDAHLGKPLKKEYLLATIIRYLHSN